MTIYIDFPDVLPAGISLVFGLVVFGGLMFVLVHSSLWAARDASQRGKSGWLVGLLVFLTWPIGLLFWLVARPNVQIRAEQPSIRRRCVHPGCNAAVRRTGTILGTATYTCDAGHEFVEPYPADKME